MKVGGLVDRLVSRLASGSVLGDLGSTEALVIADESGFAYLARRPAPPDPEPG